MAKNYWGITFISTADKIYNALLLNYIEPEIEKVLRKNQKSIHNITNSDNPSDFQSLCQKPWGHTDL